MFKSSPKAPTFLDRTLKRTRIQGVEGEVEEEPISNVSYKSSIVMGASTQINRLLVL